MSQKQVKISLFLLSNNQIITTEIYLLVYFIFRTKLIPYSNETVRAHVTGRSEGVFDKVSHKLQTTIERTGLAAGTSLYKKHVLKNWFAYIILSKKT